MVSSMLAKVFTLVNIQRWLPLRIDMDMTMQKFKSAFPDAAKDTQVKPGTDSVVLAGGCFWCVEAVYRLLRGVHAVTPGYAGDTVDKANYKTVCTGRTRHAEAVKIEFDSQDTTLGKLLKVFFSVAHDPTQADGQGNDIGPQYRSAIFYRDEPQKEIAAAYMTQLKQSGLFSQPLATTLEPLTEFFPAEAYHHNYAQENLDQPYIACVAMPKVELLRQMYPALLK